jgi:hypothetical protein
MPFSFRPAKRENTPLIIGIAGPTKSGKTYSALRVATGLANGAPVIMLNAEGARGHQYADTFKYLACDLVPPYRYPMYEEALREAAAQKPGGIIIDSMSHAHDGPGGFLEWHEEEVERMGGSDMRKRERVNFAAWIKPKAAENAFRYALLEVPCPVILCMRAKEKVKIVKGQEPVDLGWQPLVGESINFETIFTLLLPPRSMGVPDLSMSEMREPFGKMVPIGQPISEDLGQRLAAWAKGSPTATRTAALTPSTADSEPVATSGGGTGGPQPDLYELEFNVLEERLRGIKFLAEFAVWREAYRASRGTWPKEAQARMDALGIQAKARLTAT